jgi:hypothetical protein
MKVNIRRTGLQDPEERQLGFFREATQLFRNLNFSV